MSLVILRQSTAGQEVVFGPMVDPTDGTTFETGLTISNTEIRIHKEGATTLANKNSGGATHIENGVYYCVLDATDTNTLGNITLYIYDTAALMHVVRGLVLPAAIYDSLIAGSDTLPADVTQWSGTNVASPDTAGHPKVTIKSGTGTGELTLTSGAANINMAQSLPGSPTADTTGDALKQATREEAPKRAVALSDIPFYLVSSTDHVTPVTGATVTAQVSKDGGAFAAGGGTVSEISAGVYVYDASAGDMTADVVVLKFTATGADPFLLSLSTVD